MWNNRSFIIKYYTLRYSLPGGSKVRGKVRLILEQTKSPFIKLIIPAKANKVGNPKTQRRETSLSKAKYC